MGINLYFKRGQNLALECHMWWWMNVMCATDSNLSLIMQLRMKLPN